MQDFGRLYAELDASTSTAAKVQALRSHLGELTPADAAWTVYLLSGGKPRQAVPTAVLRRAACEAAGIDDWLFEECYGVVGDLAETIAHVLPHGALADTLTSLRPQDGLAAWMERGLLPLRGLEPQAQVMSLRGLWSVLDGQGRFLLTKLVGGGFRVGVSRLLVQRAVAEHAGLEPNEVAQRMMGYTQSGMQPTAERWLGLVQPATGDVRLEEGRPYPFFLAQAVDAADEPRLDDAMGPASDWMAEWKYDGIRAQVVRRGEGVWIWSRGEELITDRFPEVVEAVQALPAGTVLDGELLVVQDGRPAPFADLQTRITRKTISRSLRERTPVGFVAYDLLEREGRDARARPQWERRQALEALWRSWAVRLNDAVLGGVTVAGAGADADADAGLLGAGRWSVSPLVAATDWAELRRLRAGSRERGVEGFMLKHRLSPYGVGRRKVGTDAVTAGGWWKWKIEPMTVDAVMVYAQAGHGRRANLYTDYTFAVWNRAPKDEAEVQAVLQAIARREPPQEEGLRLVPFAKAYSGLTDEEFARVDRVIRSTTVEKFGPVRSVVPSLVFELGFEGIARSTRHKSGVAVRFPRMLRWRTDKPLREADTLATLEALGRWGVAQDTADAPDDGAGLTP